MAEICEVCGDEFEMMQRRDEVKDDMVRVVSYKRCRGCGAGRVDYHPYMPVLDAIGEEE